MPNKKQAKKKVRSDKKRKASNDVLRLAITKMSKALTKLSPKKATADLPKVQSAIAKAAKKGVIHKKTAARKIGRAMRKVNASK